MYFWNDESSAGHRRTSAQWTCSQVQIQREGGKKNKGWQVSDNETGCLTLTSAFLLRRLLAAAERQKETPSDGRVHIIHLQDRSRPPGRCSHDGACTHWPQSHLLIKTPPDLECRDARSLNSPRCRSPSSLASKGGRRRRRKKKIWAEFSPPSKEKKETLPPSHKKRH